MRTPPGRGLHFSRETSDHPAMISDPAKTKPIDIRRKTGG